MILSKFFRWLYNPGETDIKKRITPPCIQGARRLPRKETSPYKPSDLWDQEETNIFLKYCPSPRDRAFHAMAIDTSARPHELLNLKIGDIIFKKASDATQYAEILVSGKTKSRTLPLIQSLPYVKEWIQSHPHSANSNACFVSFSKWNRHGKLTRDGLLKVYEEHYKKRYFPALLSKSEVPERDKSYIKYLLTKPWNLYILRHSALTEKSKILKEHILRDHAGWSITSKMPQVYIHYFGTESSNSLLAAYGIVKDENSHGIQIKPIQCPNCGESNISHNRFCMSCKMVLKYDAYNETIEQKEQQNEAITVLADQVTNLIREVETLKKRN